MRRRDYFERELCRGAIEVSEDTSVCPTSYEHRPPSYSPLETLREQKVIGGEQVIINISASAILLLFTAPALITWLLYLRDKKLRKTKHLLIRR
ncbi:MAG: hypothetical protein KME29_05060 [Calothrix sp. FI2-JRJ7]|jgi:hypothetical protein|nr:hypothetical protein [Calothrix sp. FI2-JRJ7]